MRLAQTISDEPVKLGNQKAHIPPLPAPVPTADMAHQAWPPYRGHANRRILQTAPEAESLSTYIK